MAKKITTKRGLDIQISGKAKEITGDSLISDIIAIFPDNYHGIEPKVVVKEGDLVKAGTVIFHDKTNVNIKFVAPVSGKILAINLDEQRKVSSITITRDHKIKHEKFSPKPVIELTGDEVKSEILNAGIWPFIKQRPYDIVADPTNKPKAIFISTFDSAPLAPDYLYSMRGQGTDFQT